MRKINALAIAPYDGLRNLLENTIEERNDIELHSYIGDLKKGADLVLSIPNLNNYDVIISRGGTAEMIQKVVHIPVIDIRLTEYDIMRSIKLAQNYSGRFAIVGFPNIIRRAKIICDLMQYQIDTYIITSEEEAEKIIGKLQRKDYSLIVGDVITVEKAKVRGLNGILITSGSESINEALDEAMKLVKAVDLSARQTDLYLDILNNANTNIIAYNKDQSLAFSNLSFNQDQVSNIKKKLINYIEKTKEKSKLKLMLKSDGYIWNIKGVAVKKEHTEYTFFYINKLFDVSVQDETSFVIRNITERKNDSIINFYLSSGSTKAIIEKVTKFAQTREPILIYGENGTGKDNIAYHIHINSTLRNQPFCQVDCRSLTVKQIENLLYKENSPLTENDITLYLKNIDCLDKDNQLKLVNYIDDSFLHNRNRVIYSTKKTLNTTDMDTLVDYLIGNASICITIPPLRLIKEEIPSLASIYISELNLELGKQIAGATDRAMKLLEDFPWDLNFFQFINVLKKLILVTDSLLIQEEDTRTILEEEKVFFNQSQKDFLQLSGTLDDITSTIIQQVLEEEDMNQSKAAKRLGISRSTLWRKLKSEMK